MIIGALFLVTRLLAHAGSSHNGPGHESDSNYDLTGLIEDLNLQFCTIVEIGQGYCSMFVEFRENPASCSLERKMVEELFLGVCECSTIRSWEFCSLPLRKARPYECSFDEKKLNTSEFARVHRRLCDPTMMIQTIDNRFCDCGKQFAQRTLYPVEGFLTCHRAPMPRSICTNHNVCGVYSCRAESIFGFAVVRCDPNCLGKQPFCEKIGPATSKAPTVTSVWSKWTPSDLTDNTVDVAESICLENDTHSPAFDCLGAGINCCPSESYCVCEVTTTMSEMKITRFILKSNETRRTTPFPKKALSHESRREIKNKLRVL